MELVVVAFCYHCVGELRAVEGNEALREFKPFAVACGNHVLLAVDKCNVALYLLLGVGKAVEGYVGKVVNLLCRLAGHIDVVAEHNFAVHLRHGTFLDIFPVLYIFVGSFGICLF